MYYEVYVIPDIDGGVAVPIEVAALLFTLSGRSPLTLSVISFLRFCCSLAK